MLGRIVRTRVLARVAVIGLTLGLSALAALAVYSTASTAQTTSRVRSGDEISDQWSQIFQHVNFENEMLLDSLKINSAVGRQPLISALGSAEPNLRWLETQAGPEEAAAVESTRESYETYTDTLRQLIDAAKRGDRAEVALQTDQSKLSAASLRKLAVTNVVRKRLEMNAYLAEVDEKNRTLQIAGGVICALDFLFLTLCGLILFSHQRRIARQSVESQHQALHDGLTGLPNRVLLHDRLNQALREAGRPKESVALLMLDLNRFKEINDTLGHHAGDLLLKIVADRLAEAVRDYDTVARLGGDEFAMVLPRVASPEHAKDIAGRILDALQTPADLDGVVVDVSGSIGVSVYPRASTNATELLQHADIAMYTAKRGHLGTAMYDPATDQSNSDHLVLLGELREGIANDELTLRYQPKIEASSSRICGAETLVSWQHPTRGLLGPNILLPLAEDGNLTRQLTGWVLNAALKQHREWARAGRTLPIAVSIATHSLRDPGFPNHLATILTEYAVAPGQLTLAITNSALNTDVVRTTEALNRLRNLGVRLAIDDFDIGYSSMVHLKTMPLDELRLDPQLIATIRSSPADQAITQAIIQLAHALHLEVEATDVEDAATWTILTELGCDIAQGPHWSGPLTATDMANWSDLEVTLSADENNRLAQSLSANCVAGGPGQVTPGPGPGWTD